MTVLNPNPCYEMCYIGLNVRKPVFGGLRITQAQTLAKSDQPLSYSLF